MLIDKFPFQTDFLTSRAFERVARLWARSAIVRARSASERARSASERKQTRPDQTRKPSERLWESLLRYYLQSLLNGVFITKKRQPSDFRMLDKTEKEPVYYYWKVVYGRSVFCCTCELSNLRIRPAEWNSLILSVMHLSMFCLSMGVGAGNPREIWHFQFSNVNFPTLGSPFWFKFPSLGWTKRHSQQSLLQHWASPESNNYLVTKKNNGTRKLCACGPEFHLIGHFEYTSKSNTEFEDSFMSLRMIFWFFISSKTCGRPALVKTCK